MEGHMAISAVERKEAFVRATEEELRSLEGRGVCMVGNAFAPIVMVKGDLNAAELAGSELLSGPDGRALRSALDAIGYAPEDFCALAAVSVREALASPLDPDLFREALEALDPEAVLVLDETAADVVREAYADALVVIEDFETAMLAPGLVAPVLGRRLMVLDGFEAALSDPQEKRRMWSYIKRIGPAGEPY